MTLPKNRPSRRYTRQLEAHRRDPKNCPAPEGDDPGPVSTLRPMTEARRRRQAKKSLTR